MPCAPQGVVGSVDDPTTSHIWRLGKWDARSETGTRRPGSARRSRGLGRKVVRAEEHVNLSRDDETKAIEGRDLVRCRWHRVRRATRAAGRRRTWAAAIIAYLPRPRPGSTRVGQRPHRAERDQVIHDFAHELDAAHRFTASS